MRRSMLALMVALLPLGACVKQQVPARGSGLGPSLVLEQFMRAVNAKDFLTMGRLFGTKDGPVLDRDGREATERRMFTLSTILNHDDYEVMMEQQVPGRTEEATQLIVRIKAGALDNRVPFTFVRYKDNNWLVEQIGIDVITKPN